MRCGLGASFTGAWRGWGGGGGAIKGQGPRLRAGRHPLIGLESSRSRTGLQNRPHLDEKAAAQRGSLHWWGNCEGHPQSPRPPVPCAVVDPGLLMGGESIFQLPRPAPPLPALHPHPATHLNWGLSLHSSTLGRRVRHSSLVCATFSGHSLAMMDLSSSMMVFSVWKISCSVCGEHLRDQKEPELALVCLVARSCLTLCHPIDRNPPGSSVHGDSPGKNTEGGCHALLQGNLPNPGIEPRSLALQADSSPSEPPGKNLHLTNHKYPPEQSVLKV